MTEANHYQTLQVSQAATQGEIKRAYRRLAKRFHPDSQRESADPETIVRINAAYEVLGDPDRRRAYDHQLISGPRTSQREHRAADAQSQHQRRRQAEREAEAHRQQWFNEIYHPLNQLVSYILNSLERQVDQLAADPFDDDLMAGFQRYLGECRFHFERARQVFASQPNPAQLAEVAATLYYCLNHIGDGLEELELFSLNYDDRHLHTGKELFRMANRLHREVQR